MKKIFTLIAMALVAAGANAQDWKATADAPAAGSNLVTTSSVTISTVNETTAAHIQNPETSTNMEVTIDGYTFDYQINVRTADAASASNPNGGLEPGCTPIIIDAKENVDVTLYFRRQKGSDGFNNNDNKDLLCFPQDGSKFESEEVVSSLISNDSYGYVSKLFKLTTGKYTLYRKGSTINLFGIKIAAGTYVEPEPPASNVLVVAIPEGFSKGNQVTLTNDVVMKCMNAEKSVESAKTIKVDGKDYTTIKISNGAQNLVTMPEGKYAVAVTFYSYVNKKAAEAADRDCYWKEVNGEQFTIETGGKMEDFNDVTDYQSNPDVSPKFNLGGVSSFTFTNSGYQPCLVMVIELGDASGIESVKNETINLNAPMFNLAGQKVAEGYKGVVIQNGRKMVK